MKSAPGVRTKKLKHQKPAKVPVRPLYPGKRDCINQLENDQFGSITKRKQAELALRQSEELFYKVFHNSGAAISVVRVSDGKFIEANKRYLDLVEYAREELVGKIGWDINLLADSLDKVKSKKASLVASGYLENYEMRLRSKSGKIVTLLVSSTLACFQGEQCSIHIGQDITGQKEMEFNMQRLDSLNLVGEMAASIGHEIRNPLTTIRGYLQLFQGRRVFDEYQEQLATMIEEVDRANCIITEFLSLSKNKSVEMQHGNLNKVIMPLFQLIQADAFQMNHQVSLETTTLPNSEFDPREIRQLVLNLTRNALEAMKTPGVLKIRTYCTTDAVVLEVQDSGTGFPGHVLQQLGKPFVTTKEFGTGLGLAVCYRIAQRHNAELRIKTSPRGTVVCVRFRK